MAIYGYTKNYKLIKPQFDTDTWHDYIYDNLDTIDAIMSAIYSSGNWQGFWKKNTHYDVGDVIIDRDTDTMYKVLVEHTTSENTFALEQAAHPTYYELWSPNDLAESWAIKMDGLVSFTDYSAKAYAISSALIDAGSAKEWAVKTDGTIGTTGEYSAKKHATDAASSASTAASEASDAANSATLSQKWAVDANLVASTDYSSKSWATGSLDAGSAKDWAIKEGGSVGTTGKYSAKVYSLAAQNHYEKARDWASKTNGQVESTDYSAKAYAISEGLISAGSAKEWSNKAKAWATSTSIVEDGKYGASYYALQAYNANVTAQIAKTTAQEWASKMDGQVASTDYSSKYYAGQSATSANNSQVWAEGTDVQVQALGGTHSAKVWAEQSTNANIDLSNLSAAGNDKFVTKNTEQTITQHKTFTSAPSIKNTNLPSNSTIPDSGENNVWLYANANDDSYIGGIGFSVTTTASRTLLFTRKNINGTNYSCYSANIIENDGTIYFNVPTPPATHNMNSAATTKWVNDHRCTTAATTASSASIYKPAIVIENYRNGNQWYRKWSDGWIEQGGYKSQATPNTITLNKAFTTTDYTILALCDRMDASAAPAVAAYRNNSNYPKSTTAFTLTGNTASLGQYWYACGY